MAVSYVKHTTLTCPQCGAEVEAGIWLIVDTSERPDLVEKIRKNTLHRVTCPTCGHTWEVDAPLLLFTPPTVAGEGTSVSWPRDLPPLLFSPARETSAEEDLEHAAGLLTHLWDALGDAWEEAWVAQGLPAISRDLLPLALTKGWEAAKQEKEGEVRVLLYRRVRMRAIMPGDPKPEPVIYLCPKHGTILPDNVDWDPDLQPKCPHCGKPLEEA